MPQCWKVYGGVYFWMKGCRKRWICGCGSSACVRNPSLDTPADAGAVCVSPRGSAACKEGNGGEKGEESAVARSPQPP